MILQHECLVTLNLMETLKNRFCLKCFHLNIITLINVIIVGSPSSD